MRIFTIVLLLLLETNTFCQNNFHGSYLAAIICKGGIVIGTDSRAVLTDNNHQVFAYYEGIAKMYQYNNIVIAVAGNLTFSKLTADGLFQEFKKKHREVISLNSFLKTFQQFAKQIITSEDYADLISNTYFECSPGVFSPSRLARQRPRDLIAVSLIHACSFSARSKSKQLLLHHLYLLQMVTII